MAIDQCGRAVSPSAIIETLISHYWGLLGSDGDPKCCIDPDWGNVKARFYKKDDLGFSPIFVATLNDCAESAMNSSCLEIELGGYQPRNHSRLSCQLDGLSTTQREEQRLQVLQHLGLLNTRGMPIFDEAAQTVARNLELPICWLTVMVQDELWIKSAIGLSCLGLMNPLASTRKLDRSEAYCTQVVDSCAPVIVSDTLAEPLFIQGELYQRYGIRAYLGVPLLTAEEICLGTLAVFDLSPHQFSLRDVEFVSMTARWCMGEFERDWLKGMAAPPTMTAQQNGNSMPLSSPGIAPPRPLSHSLSDIKLRLVKHLLRQAQPPLTAVIGMSSVLKGEVFGPLNSKQTEYTRIIHRSGEQISAAIAQILSLDHNGTKPRKLELTSVNIELLAQQVINQIAETVNQKELSIKLSVEPGRKVWLLDKNNVRQALYYLLISLLDNAQSDAEIRIHLSRRQQHLSLATWLYHPCLGDGLPQIPLQPAMLRDIALTAPAPLSPRNRFDQTLTIAKLEALLERDYDDLPLNGHQNQSHHLLGLLLSVHLCESHGGNISVQGSPDAGYRYVSHWPKITPSDEP
jgi:hypothetical protein